MADTKILVVDDESRMRKLIKDFLTNEGYLILEAKDGEEALDKYRRIDNIALIILDVMLPNLDGFEVLSQIRLQDKGLPVIMLTAKSTEEDELKGYDLGVDEYITKPFSPKILAARVEALLRRSGTDITIVKRAGDIVLNGVTRVVTVKDEDIILSFKEFELLEFFIDHEGEALSRDKILASVWNIEYQGDTRTVDTHIKKLRTKLGKCENYIQTCWGYGYKFKVVE